MKQGRKRKGTFSIDFHAARLSPDALAKSRASTTLSKTLLSKIREDVHQRLHLE